MADEATLPADDFLDEQLRELNRTLAAADGEGRARSRVTDDSLVDWKHLPRPVLIVFVLFCVGTISSLGTALLNLKKTDMDTIRTETRRNRDDIENLKGDLREWNSRWAQWITTLESNTRAMNGLSARVDEYREEQLRSYRAAARRRGDEVEVQRIDKTLGKIAAGKPGG